MAGGYRAIPIASACERQCIWDQRNGIGAVNGTTA